MKRVLILGGTAFVGRILTESLLHEGYNVTLFNRGKRNPGLFQEAKKLIGDRNTDDIEQIRSGSWDVVVDFSCMFPDSLERAADILKGKVERYIFVSTASVYPMDDAAMWQSPVKEDAALLGCTPEQRKDPDVMATYGEKKAECERVLLSKEWLDPIIFRPGLIYGKFDYTDRFYYWLYKIYKQDKILIPDNGNDKLTNTYSIDFARMIKAAIECSSHRKYYNAVTHDEISLMQMFEIESKLLRKSPAFINASTEFLDKNKVGPWGDLPLWLHGTNLSLDNTKVKKDLGITFQSFEESVQGCIDYYSTLGWPVPAYGISAEKEAELIDKLM